jgi:hypothetical protein
MNATVNGFVDGVSHLKAGDRVGFYRCHMGTLIENKFGTVTNVNRYGHILVTPDDAAVLGGVPDVTKNRVFDKHGNEKTERCGTCAVLCTVTYLQDWIASDEEDNRQQKAVSTLLDAIASHKCGNGRYNVTQEIKTELKNLVDAI